MFYERDREPGEMSPASSENQPSRNLTNSAKLRCPVCDQHFDQSTTKAMPFCSARCRQIDLGRWLTESYGMPFEGNDRAEGFDEPTTNDD